MHKVEQSNPITPENAEDHKADEQTDQKASPFREAKFKINSDLVDIEEPNKKPDVLELYNLESISPYADDKPEIQFNYSPRNLDGAQFVDKLTQSQAKLNSGSSQHQSVEEILGRIPKEYFRSENKYESIDAVLDHISRKREEFMKSINLSPDNRHLSKTIEPIMNSVSPHARQK